MYKYMLNVYSIMYIVAVMSNFFPGSLP